MQRHFSNRGEAHAEVIAARMLAGKRRAGRPTFSTPTSKRWFLQVEEKGHPIKKPHFTSRADDKSATL